MADIQDEAGPFLPPTISPPALLSGVSQTYFSPIPPQLLADNTPCCLGVDEAGRGPVLGPMVYSAFYLPLTLSDPLLKQKHSFDDSKVLTPAVRLSLMKELCTKDTELHDNCGYATSSLSPLSISSGMLKASKAQIYNLNQQAMDATIALIKGIYERGVNVTDIFIDTIGQPAAYQKKLERVFPTAKITVAKKADSLYPVVSAASVVAKVTRDIALEVLWADRTMAWGSGYPSDSKCVSWLKQNMHPVFGWGPECRFSWGTAKDMLETKGGVKVDWPEEEEEETQKLTDFFMAKRDQAEVDVDDLGTWFGAPAGVECF
uniref:Ribonuclease H2 subunit A n=1 Tax=Neurospora crassa (strain ATCC 24698 / 74-OR23-1A / CBS 708.71 / DSM 1257 / FGSC 987) TaxID=367110 RepID=RNH2A_NEUCR|nr:RecName: Full=Ribonuclease H2 subunit A; Short=RNase H2 subunit A; AltName: Full=Ribonuclease HI large subunit; Short=RNase HI large subunit; AltName: Full=Ribonuclease HI subunit A [Neurospora crassa OR74A]CAB91392.1 probable 35 kDa ribonuclease H [Neurospora crassa]